MLASDARTDGSTVALPWKSSGSIGGLDGQRQVEHVAVKRYCSPELGNGQVRFEQALDRKHDSSMFESIRWSERAPRRGGIVESFRGIPEAR